MKAGAGSQQLLDILIPGEDWTLVADGYKFTEGPAANARGEVFFNDTRDSYRPDAAGDAWQKSLSLFRAELAPGR